MNKKIILSLLLCMPNIFGMHSYIIETKTKSFAQPTFSMQLQKTTSQLSRSNNFAHRDNFPSSFRTHFEDTNFPRTCALHKTATQDATNFAQNLVQANTHQRTKLLVPTLKTITESTIESIRTASEPTGFWKTSHKIETFQDVKEIFEKDHRDPDAIESFRKSREEKYYKEFKAKLDEQLGPKHKLLYASNPETCSLHVAQTQTRDIKEIEAQNKETENEIELRAINSADLKAKLDYLHDYCRLSRNKDDTYNEIAILEDLKAANDSNIKISKELLKANKKELDLPLANASLSNTKNNEQVILEKKNDFNLLIDKVLNSPINIKIYGHREGDDYAKCLNISDAISQIRCGEKEQYNSYIRSNVQKQVEKTLTERLKTLSLPIESMSIEQLKNTKSYLESQILYLKQQQRDFEYGDSKSSSWLKKIDENVRNYFNDGRPDSARASLARQEVEYARTIAGQELLGRLNAQIENKIKILESQKLTTDLSALASHKLEVHKKALESANLLYQNHFIDRVNSFENAKNSQNDLTKVGNNNNSSESETKTEFLYDQHEKYSKDRFAAAKTDVETNCREAIVKYEVDKELQEAMTKIGENPTILMSLDGGSFQQATHSQIIETSNSIIKTNGISGDVRTLGLDLMSTAYKLNASGESIKAGILVDFCNVLVAVSKGVATGALNATNPIRWAKTYALLVENLSNFISTGLTLIPHEAQYFPSWQTTNELSDEILRKSLETKENLSKFISHLEDRLKNGLTLKNIEDGAAILTEFALGNKIQSSCINFLKTQINSPSKVGALIAKDFVETVQAEQKIINIFKKFEDSTKNGHQIAGNGPALRKIDFMKRLEHSFDRHFLDRHGKHKNFALIHSDPMGNPEKWIPYIIDLAQSGEGVTKVIPGFRETIEIFGKMPKTGTEGFLDIGVRMGKPIGSDVWELNTILTHNIVK